MTRAQNDALATVFTEVRASRGIGKSRALIATGLREAVAAPAAVESSARVTVRGQQCTIALRGLGAVFGGASADAGSRLLLETLDPALAAGSSLPPTPQSRPLTPQPLRSLPTPLRPRSALPRTSAAGTG